MSVPVNLVAFEEDNVVDILFTTELTNPKELLQLASQLAPTEQFIYAGNFTHIIGLRVNPKTWKEFLKRNGTDKEVESFQNALTEAKKLYEKEQQTPATETFTYENSDIALQKLTDAFKIVHPEVEIKGFSWILEDDGIDKLRLSCYSPQIQDQDPLTKGVDVSLKIYKEYLANEVRIVIKESDALIPIDYHKLLQELKAKHLRPNV